MSGSLDDLGSSVRYKVFEEDLRTVRVKVPGIPGGDGLSAFEKWRQDRGNPALTEQDFYVYIASLVNADESYLSGVSGETLGGHKVVFSSVSGFKLADAGNASHVGKVVGITTGASSQGDPALVQPFGQMDEPSWSWTPGPVFLGFNGSLTQAPPRAVFEQQVATALTATRILVSVDPPFVFS